MSFEDFKREALKLPRGNRAELAADISKSLDEDDDNPSTVATLPDEVRRRHQAFKEGKVKLLSYEELLAGLD